ncbi:MAG: hypothetical protein PVH03_10145 [Chloroflexota bacterium]
MSRAELALHGGQVPAYTLAASAYRPEHIGGELLHVAWIQAVGWPLESIGLLPVGSLLLVIAYYAAARNITPSFWSAAAITMFAGWYYPNLYAQYATHLYALTNILFLSFLILLLSWIRKRTPSLSVAIALLFVATFLHYHTTPLWMIGALVSAVAMVRLARRYGDSSFPRASWSLPLFCLVLFLAFDTVVYGDGLARVRAAVEEEALIQSIAGKVISPLMGNQTDMMAPYQMAPINPRMATISTLLVLLILTFPVGAWCATKLARAVKSRKLAVLIADPVDIFIWIVIFTALTHLFFYSLYGALSFRVVPIVFPLLLPLVSREFTSAKAIEQILVTGLVLFAILGFFSFASTFRPEMVASEAGLVTKLLEPKSDLLVDAGVFGSLALNAAEDGQVFDLIWLESGRYASVISPAAQDTPVFDYVVADTLGKPLTSSGWRFFEPWTDHLAEIARNRELSLIYSSQNLQLFQWREEPLPDYHLSLPDITPPYHYPAVDGLRLFLALMALAFIPGTILLFIARSSTDLRFDDFPTNIGLAIGFSIAIVTIVGWLANFTPLGLKHFIPRYVFAPGVLLLLVFVLLKRPPLTGSWQLVPLLSLMLLLLIWSLLATAVARVRTDQASDFVEFFLTQAHGQKNSVTVNVVNRGRDPGRFEIRVDSDGLVVDQLGPRRLEPGSAWCTSWTFPETLDQKTITVRLQQDGVPNGELHFSRMD